MNKLHLIKMLAALPLLLSLSTGAKADLVDFSYSGDGVDASGVLTIGAASNNVGGFGLDGWDITGITGTRNGVAISGLIGDPSFPNPTIVNDIELDNGLLSSPLGFDYWGLAYSTTDGGNYNVYSNGYPTGGGYTEFQGNDWVFTAVTVSLTPVDSDRHDNLRVPDFANTAMLLIAGLGACQLFALYRRRALS